MPDLTKTPEFEKVIGDAKSDGQQLAADAQAFAHTILGHISGALTKQLPDVESAAAAAFFDLLPANESAAVKLFAGGLVAGEELQYNPTFASYISKWTGYALTRIDAFAKPLV